MFQQCFIFRKIFDEKHKAGEILFLRIINIKDFPFPKKNNRGKCHVMVKSHYEMDMEKDEQKASKGEPDLDQMAQQAQNLFKFKTFFDQMYFDT